MPIIDETRLPKVRVAQFDADHAEEARLLNASAAAVDAYVAGRADARSVLAALDALYAHTRSHVEREEAASHGASYPEHEAHQAEHERALEELDERQRAFREAGDAAALRSYLADVYAPWLEDHVRTWDVPAARFALEWGPG